MRANTRKYFFSKISKQNIREIWMIVLRNVIKLVNSNATSNLSIVNKRMGSQVRKIMTQTTLEVKNEIQKYGNEPKLKRQQIELHIGAYAFLSLFFLPDTCDLCSRFHLTSLFNVIPSNFPTTTPRE